MTTWNQQCEHSLYICVYSWGNIPRRSSFTLLYSFRVLPGALPPVISLKKTDSVDRKSPGDESYPDDSRPAVQLRHVERDSEADQYDERIGVKVSDLFDIGKDIQAGGEYQVDGRRGERKEERRYRR